MSRGAERNPLAWLARVRVQRVIRSDQLRHVDQVFAGSRLPRARTRHILILA
jgi:hypothetical protein